MFGSVGLRAYFVAATYDDIRVECPDGNGAWGTALSFDGTDDYATIPANAARLPYGNAARSVEAWVYARSTSWVEDVNTVFEYGTNATRRAFAIDFHTYPSVQFFTWGDDLIVDSSSPREGWMHLAMTYGAGTLRAYVNGVERGSRAISALDTSESPMNVGRSALVPDDHFDGVIDELRVWSTARTADEIRSNMYRALSGSESGLVGYWKFDEGTGTTAADTSGGGAAVLAPDSATPAWISSTRP
jgi:hypothetical protein